jgi:hypothetical protein
MQNTCMRLTLFALLAFSCCAEDALDNQRVAELARTVSVEKLDQIICSAPSVNFRLQEMDALLQAGVTEHTIKTMAAKENGQPCGANSTASNAPVSERPVAQHVLPQATEPSAFPPVSLYAGYSYASVDTNGLDGRVGGNGFETSAAFGFNRWLAAESDFGAYYHNFPLPAYLGLGPVANVHDFSFLAGPRISYGPAFFHVMIGVDRLTGSVPVLSLSQNSFATAMGGGVQVPIAHSHFGFRASADYVVTQHNIVSLGPGFAQNNLRVSAGIVYVSGRAQ